MNTTCTPHPTPLTAEPQPLEAAARPGGAPDGSASCAATQTLQGLLRPGLRPIQRTTTQTNELLLGEVRAMDEAGGYQVDLAGGRQLRVTLALGCLVQPEMGDLVQVFASGAHGWITMVLRRPRERSDLTLTAGDRNLRLQAPNLALAASERLSLQAERLEQRATLIEAAAQERASTVLGSDVLKAGSASWNVEGHLGLHSRTQFVTAEGLMKINAGQIHMA